MENFSGSLNIKNSVPFDSRIGVLYGGMSSEREVSLRSGKNCYEALLRLGYKNVELIDVDKNIAKTLIDKNIEIAYIALHGKYGEDGCIQGLLEILGIPYTGCGVMASAVSMNKEYTKKLLKVSRVPVISSIMAKSIDNLTEETSNLTYPLMIKPVCEGSSIGMSKVNTPEELMRAVNQAVAYKSGIMIEEFIEGQSLTVGVLDIDSDTIATPILGFKTKTEWYDYEAKYTHGMTEFILPAKINQETTKLIQDLSVKSHKAVGARGMSRVDFILSNDNKPYVLEINTIPGMTDLSDLPAQVKAMGIDYDNLVKIILNSVLLSKDSDIISESALNSLV
jgi:D-alanine-D-alanine ligase